MHRKNVAIVQIAFLLASLLGVSNAFHTRLVTARCGTKTVPKSHALFQPIVEGPLTPLSASRVFMAVSEDAGEKSSLNLRDQLRRATGFSLTAFRAALRAATGISLTAIYATSLAASGLWIRKITSACLSIFPAWFRYFLQPFLIVYYLPIFVVRSWTAPSRRDGKINHEALKNSWKDAVEFAEKTESRGYWPVQINEDGDFELVMPPEPSTLPNAKLADAVADSVEQAMENGFKPDGPTTA